MSYPARARYDAGMRAWLVLGCLAAGCAFDPRGAADGDAAPPGPDAPADDDGRPIDAPPQRCAVTPTGPVATSAQVASSTGGQSRAALTCASGELAVAFDFSLTDASQPNHGDQQVIDELRLHCGTMEVIDDVTTIVLTTTPEVVGDNSTFSPNCSNYVATTASPLARCPDGEVVVGVRVNRPDDVLFNSVALRCAPLSDGGAVSTTITTVMAAGTGANQDDLQIVDCPAGTAVVGLEPRSGCGIDGFALRCSALTCAL